MFLIVFETSQHYKPLGGALTGGGKMRTFDENNYFSHR